MQVIYNNEDEKVMWALEKTRRRKKLVSEKWRRKKSKSREIDSEEKGNVE